MNSYKKHKGNIDFLYRRLKSDISIWYDKNGDTEVKALHLHLLRKYYDPARFMGNIRLEKIKFLTELQGIVDIRSLRGMSGLS